MADEDGPLIAELVYKDIFNSDGDFITPDDVAYALDAAIQHLRHREPDPNRWAPYIHLGI
jgi:hypothetical protein